MIIFNNGTQMKLFLCFCLSNFLSEYPSNIFVLLPSCLSFLPKMVTLFFPESQEKFPFHPGQSSKLTLRNR